MGTQNFSALKFQIFGMTARIMLIYISKYISCGIGVGRRSIKHMRTIVTYYNINKNFPSQNRRTKNHSNDIESMKSIEICVIL